MIQVKGVIPLLQVFDMPAALEFYCGKLGFEKEGEGTEDWCMLRLGESLIMLNTRYENDERPARPDDAAARIHDDTTLYFDCPNVDEAYEYLVSKGVDAKKPEVTWYGMKQLHVKDPDGFGLCFQCEAEAEATSNA